MTLRDWHGRPLVQVEPAVWTWRGQSYEALRQAQDTSWDSALRQDQGTGWDTALRPAQGTEVRQAQGTIRIGDTERDQAISVLGDHFAAGRLSREEFDERSDQAMRARTGADLQPLFADLPRAPQPPVARNSRPAGLPPVFLPLFWLAPLLVVAAVVAAVVLSAPWIVWTFLWIFMFTGFWGRRRFVRRS
jgi:hypothetical protein